MGNDDLRTERLPGYDEIVDRNSITLLMKPGDLTLRDGDLAVTRWGDLMLNDEDYSAFTRLVQVWRYNFPTLRTLFRAAFYMDGEEAAEQDLDAMGSRRWDPSLGLLQGLDVDAYHATIERMEAEREARGIYAGAITLVIGRALATFRADISATRDEWNAAGPQTNGRSVGEMLEAAGNNMRHADEWQTAVTPTAQQMKSVRVLSDVLVEPIPANGAIRAFARDISPEILALLSGGDFLCLEVAIFAFANDLVSHRQLRSPSR